MQVGGPRHRWARQRPEPLQGVPDPTPRASALFCSHPEGGAQAWWPSPPLPSGGTVDSSDSHWGPGLPRSVLAPARAAPPTPTPFPLLSPGTLGGGGPAAPGGRAARRPHKAVAPSSPHSRGNYPLMRENYRRSAWPGAQGPRAAGSQGACAGRELETNAGAVCFGGFTVPSLPLRLPLSQIWTFTETDSCLGFP